MNLILLAPPAAGKGTQSEILKEKYNLNHISTGDLLREEIATNSDLGKEIAKVINSGGLVNDDLMLKILENKIKNSNSNGIIFDGFPRNTVQAKMLDELLNKYNMKIDYVFNLNIEKEVAMKRALGRLLCSKCNTIYNIYRDTFIKEGFCNKCNSKLDKRDDDNEEAFNKRFDTFFEKTKPLIEFYKEKQILYDIYCKNKKEDTFIQIQEIIEKE